MDNLGDYGVYYGSLAMMHDMWEQCWNTYVMCRMKETVRGHKQQEPGMGEDA